MQNTENSLSNTLLMWPLKFLFGLLQLVFFSGLVVVSWYILQTTGLFPARVPVSGASMLPTLPEEGYVSFRRFFFDERLEKFPPIKSYISIQRGDIVVFENQETHDELEKQDKSATGFVKRAVGVEGDLVEIRDGFVYVNGARVDEPYTLKPRSTFGGEKIHDCFAVRVPKDKLFVLGDNRKVSMDSRQIGFVSLADVQFVIPESTQEKEFGSLWRDTSHDFDSQNESLFDVDAYLKLLNEKRQKHKLPPLSYEPKLERSAKLRAQVMLKFNEFDSDGEKSGYSMKDAMNEVGYANIVYGEFPMTGYYDAQELYDAFMEQKGAIDFLLNPEYDDIGVSTFVGEMNGCPAQVVVQHLAGYIPASYSAKERSYWQEGLDRLREVQPGWVKLREYEEVYRAQKSDIDRINDIISTRIARYKQILSRVQKSDWFTDEEKLWIAEDPGLANEQNSLAERLNTAL